MSHGRQSSPSYSQGPSGPQEQQGRAWRGFRLVLIPRSLARLLHEEHQELLAAVRNLETLIMSAKDDLKAASDRVLAAVAKNTTVDESVRTLLAGFADQLRAIKKQLDDAIAAGDEAGIAAAAALLDTAAVQLEADNTKTAEAVAANTPAENSANG